MEFRPFTDRDFDAYLERKWRSNVFNRERLEVKQNLQALGRRLGPALQSAGGAPLACEVSVEHPALWNQRKVESQTLFFSRNEEARRELDTIISKQRSMAALIEDPSPLHNHIFLSLLIDKDRLELGLKLHSDASVDRENLTRKCAEFFARERLIGLLRALPQGFRVGIVGQQPQRPAAEVDDEAIQALLQALPGARSWLAVWREYRRDDPKVGDEAFVEELIAHFRSLLPVMHFAAWSRDNDHLSMRKTLKEKEEKRQSKGLSAHDQVRVVRGVFSGKRGVVTALEGKGKVKVQLGTLSIQVSSGDLEKMGR